MTLPLSLKSKNWPAVDQQRWNDALKLTSFLSGPKPAAKWSLRRCRIAEQSYGQWLSFLLRTGALDPKSVPEKRVTLALIKQFVEELETRVAPWSVVMMLQAVQRMLVVLAPWTDWLWLRQIISNLKCLAKPSRDKRSHMVSPDQLYALGASLLQQSEVQTNSYFGATMARDGLLIALLVCCPVRIANLTAIAIGRHLTFADDRYLLSFDADETKTGRAYEGELPPEMTPMFERYLRFHRQVLLARGRDVQTDRLWINRWGKPMAEAAIRAQIKKRTNDAFGKPVWPHLFRTIDATGFVDRMPEEASLIPDLLGHTNIQTSRKHYILSDGTLAHKQVQKDFLDERAEARARLREARRKGGGV